MTNLAHSILERKHFGTEKIHGCKIEYDKVIQYEKWHFPNWEVNMDCIAVFDWKNVHAVQEMQH